MISEGQDIVRGNLQGRVALVTGAAGDGMGRSIALTLAREDATVVINYRQNRQGAEAIVAAVEEMGGKALALQGNVFSREDCERLVATTLAATGRIDICIIGPGANWNPEPITGLLAEKALADVCQEIGPVYHLVPLVLRDMQTRRAGRIIGIASNMDIPSPAYSYNVAKTGRIAALQLMVPQAWELGVTVNIIAPGPVAPIGALDTAAALCRHDEAWVERANVTPQDVAEGVAFLCSDAARYITGCTLTYRF